MISKAISWLHKRFKSYFKTFRTFSKAISKPNKNIPRQGMFFFSSSNSIIKQFN
jgi:hypothetical protein